MRGKALENGTEGDAVNVMNLQSKRTVSGTVIGRGQVAITGVPSRPAQTSDAAPLLAPPVAGAAPVASAVPVAVATVNSPVAPKAE
jgi:flagellar basal body P-ring formation protein FlgA